MITGIVSFGDSLSDVGNTYLAAGTPPSPPITGALLQRADLAGLPGQQARGRGAHAEPGGRDWTTPGVVQRPATALSFMGTPNIGTQISTFLGTNTLSSTQLITVWGGANDFLNAA